MAQIINFVLRETGGQRDFGLITCETVGSMGIHSMVVERRGVRRSSVSVNGDEART